MREDTMVRQFGAEFRHDESYGHACRRCHVVRRQRRDPSDHFHGRRLVSPIEHESLTTLETRRTVPLQHVSAQDILRVKYR